MPLDSKLEGVVYDASYDVLVIGGGLAGVCAAIAAARNGCTVGLAHDRPVLGGNSSSEIRVNAGGADHHGARRHARESGIIEQLRLEDRLRNHEPVANGRINFVWDHVLLGAVRRETSLDLYLNTSAQQAIMSDESTLEGVVAYQSSTYRTLHLRGCVFIDASGDGVVAADAGAHYRVGREGRGEFNEPAAPERSDALTLGSSILFRARDLGRPVPFTPPPWAHRFEEDDFPHRPLRGFAHAGFWWIEYGGTLDTIADSETIRDQLLAYVLGVWDYIKNRSDLEAKTYALDWVGALPGKRESRRFLGDHILTQADLVGAKAFPDAVAYGGWPIDLHPPQGIHAEEPPARFVEVPSVYPIPLSCLYSRNIRNLMFAGRNISASHVAFGSTRLMATGAVMGQAVGTAAALCKARDATPRKLRYEHIRQLQQALLRDGAYIPGVANEDPGDLARLAHASATSSAALRVDEASEPVALSSARAQLLPVSADRLDAVEVPITSSLDHEVELRATLHWAQALDDFSHHEPAGTALGHVHPRASEWVRLEFHQALKPHALYFLALEPVEGLAWMASEAEPPGTQRATRKADGQWAYLGEHGTLGFRLWPQSRPFEPESVVDGVARPEGWPNLWVSDPEQELPQSLTLDFGAPRAIASVLLTFDTDVNHLVDFGPAPTCVRSYVLWAKVGGEWRELARQEDNHQRRRAHTFEPVEAAELRLDVLATHGTPTARVYEVRAYGP
ncbi:MAG: FAD-dependent oxidoreductase [Candidatus Brocadiia bacterium]